MNHRADSCGSMIRRCSLRVTTTAAAVLLGGLAGASAAAAYWNGAGAVQAQMPVGDAAVSVQVEPPPPLYPGSHGNVRVTVKNQGHGDFTIRRLVLPEEPAFNDCDGVTLGEPSAVPAIPAGESRTFEIPVSMADDASVACQGATTELPVRVEGDWT